MADETTTRAPSSPIDFSAPVTNDASAHADAGAPNATGGAACAKCAKPLTGYYYESAGAVYCPKCKHAAETAAGAAGGQGGGMGRAALLGLGAAIVGAIGYWAFIKITNWDWALVSIAVGVLVATAIRKANGNRGGRRFQVLAVALTYFAIGSAYAPFVIQGIVDARTEHATAAVTAARGRTSSPTLTAQPTATAAASAVTREAESLAAPSTDSAVTHAKVATAKQKPQPAAAKALPTFLIAVIAVALAGPIVIIAGGLPGSIINLAIVGFALRRAWIMTARGVGVVPPTFSGPYNVRSRPAAAGGTVGGAAPAVGG